MIRGIPFDYSRTMVFLWRTMYIFSQHACFRGVTECFDVHLHYLDLSIPVCGRMTPTVWSVSSLTPTDTYCVQNVTTCTFAVFKCTSVIFPQKKKVLPVNLVLIDLFLYFVHVSNICLGVMFQSSLNFICSLYQISKIDTMYHNRLFSFKCMCDFLRNWVFF